MRTVKNLPRCPKCNSDYVMKNGRRRYKKGVFQGYHCADCKNFWTGPLNSSNNFISMEGTTDTYISNLETKSLTGITEEELRRLHDVSFKVREAVTKLKKGIFLQEYEFIKMADIKAGMRYKQVLEHPDFKDYHGKAGSIVYWSHSESIDKLKSDGVLN
jgi:hypothetical protein